MSNKIWTFLLTAIICFGGCDRPADTLLTDRYQHQKASIDRFSDEAGTLFQRSKNPDLPTPDEPINFDEPPFLIKGLGPNGEIVEYYNFDEMPDAPAPLYVFFREEENTPVTNQDNIANVIPGDPGYNDFWQIYKVFVPSDYKANSVTSLADIRAREYKIQPLSKIVNCPIVPDGSTANKRFSNDENAPLHRGWYKNKIIYYFTFSEKTLEPTQNGQIPTSTLFVTYNTNPMQKGGGFSSGFKTEADANQTHNVMATTPTDTDYSALRTLNVYDNASFEMVSDLSSAQDAHLIENNASLVNHPLANIQQR